MKKNKSWFRYMVRDRLASLGQKVIYFDITEDATITGADYIATVLTINKKGCLFRYAAHSNNGEVYMHIDRCIGRLKGGRK